MTAGGAAASIRRPVPACAPAVALPTLNGTPMSTKPLALLIALGLGAAAPLAAYATAMPDSPAKTDAAAAPAADIKSNPFYAQSPLPYQYPQFDKIHDA